MMNTLNPNPHAQAAYTALLHRLDRIRGGMRLRDLAVAVSWMAIVLIPIAAVLLWFDYHYRPGSAGRVLALIVLIVSLAEVLRRRVWPLVSHSRDRSAVALEIERLWPELDARLVATVELGGRPEPRSDLINRTIKEAGDLCAKTPLESVVDWPSRRKMLIPAVVLILFALASVAMSPSSLAIWFSRTFAPWTDVEWPSRTSIELVNVPERVRRGDPLVVEGRITGLVPREGTMLVRAAPSSAGGSSWRRIPFRAAPSGVFAATYEPALSGVELHAVAGDGRSEDRRVEVVTPPEVSGVRGLLKYRAYTGKEPIAVEGGGLDALIGTEADLTIRSTRPIVKGELVFHSGESIAAAVTSATECTASFEIRRDDKYEIRLYDQYNYTADSPVAWDVHAIEDELPSVLIREPESEKRVTPLSQVTVRAEGHDDFRVVDAAIAWEIEGSGGSSGDLAGAPIPIAMPAQGRGVEVITVWDLAGLGLQPRQKIRYWVEMGDEAPYREDGEKGRSAPSVLIVMEPVELRKIIDERLTSLYEQLEDIERQVTRGLDEVSEVSAAILGQATSPQAIASTVRAEEWRQSEVARRLLTVAKGLETTAQDLVSAHLAQPDESERLAEAGRSIGALSKENLETILTELRSARRNLEGVE